MHKKNVCQQGYAGHGGWAHSTPVDFLTRCEGGNPETGRDKKKGRKRNESVNKGRRRTERRNGHSSVPARLFTQFHPGRQ